ncbi:MAG: hypothetical protein GF398_00855 [Chitinivibrionales bacterium]|nr:hypothetical protein [Chitinivibrionales bacterium]
MIKSLLLICAISSIVLSGTFYVDPAVGKATNDGSQSSPWKSLQQVVADNLFETTEFTSYPFTAAAGFKPRNAGAPIQPGDTILLLSGYHGDVTIRRAYNNDYITIKAAENHSPSLRSLKLSAVRKWIISGLTISPEQTPQYDQVRLIHIESHGYSGPASDVIIQNCSLYSVRNTSSWSMQDWNDKACNGINLNGTRCIARNNTLLNVNFGISSSGDSNLVEYNTITNFAGDGLRGLGDDNTFRYNTVKNCYDVNGNHDDGFQSWSSGPGGVGTGTVFRMQLIGNTIINYEDPNQPFRGTLQGIGCFDGMFEDWQVMNNVVIVDHWHGITLSGARNCSIINNTVIDANDDKPGPSWIRIGNHKNGTASTGCVVVNNLGTSFSIDSASCAAYSHNIDVTNRNDFFVDFASFNMRLKPEAAAVNSGNNDFAPDLDIARNARPVEGIADIGAHEYRTAAPAQNAVMHSVRPRTNNYALHLFNAPISSPAALLLINGRMAPQGSRVTTQSGLRPVVVRTGE